MTLQPYEYFTLFIQLDDHTDLNRDTYCVRSIIRNARSSKILDTVNLESKGSGDYSTPWQVPADVTGLGTYIKVVTSVYTDNTYLTKVAAYSDEGDIYLIEDRKRPNGGGGADVNYKKIQTLIDEAVSKIKLPEASEKEIDFSQILLEITSLKTALSALPRYEDSATPLKKQGATLLAVLASLKALDKPEKEIDLSPVMDKLFELTDSVDSVAKNKTSDLETITEIKTNFETYGADFFKQLETFLETIKQTKLNFQVTPETPINRARSHYYKRSL